MRIEYSEGDHANIYLELGVGPAADTVVLDRGVGFIHHLHFNSQGQLYGIEVIEADKLLRPGFVKRFANRNAKPS